jgi:hypothetical protein
MILSVSAAISGLLLRNRLVLPYTTEGTYFDEDSGVVYHEQAIFFFAIIGFILFSMALLAWSFWIVKLRNKV